MTSINGMDVESLRRYVGSIREDRAVADRHFAAVAHWEGETRSRVEVDGRKSLSLGGNDEFSGMHTVLAALAACDIEVIATHATLLGLQIKDLRVEVEGGFNVASLLGVESPTDAAYESINYRVVMDAPGATEEQIARLREACEQSSPVGDSLRNALPVSFEFETSD
jgi:uncharacterized OsmC-like protein